MRILMLSTDSQIFNEASAVRARILEYGKLFEELHVVVYTSRPTTNNQQPTTIAKNVFIYPTNSRSKFLYFCDAYRIAKCIIHDSSFLIHDSVITSQDPFETGLVAWHLKRKFNIRWQAQIHTDFLSPYFAAASLKNRLRVLLAKWLIKKADRIRVVSDRIKHSLVTRYPLLATRTTVLPIFVDIEKFRQGSPDAQFIQKNKPDGTFLILTVARRAPEKNIELANSIIGEIKSRGHKVKWLHIGYGSNAKADIGWLDEFIENPLVIAPYYKMADLFLLTSNYEGYGMAAVEAAAAGVPVVMTDVGVALGRIFPVGNKEKAVEIIDKLIKNPTEREAVIAEQNKFLENWPTREQYLEQYKKSLTF